MCIYIYLFICVYVLEKEKKTGGEDKQEETKDSCNQKETYTKSTGIIWNLTLPLSQACSFWSVLGETTKRRLLFRDLLWLVEKLLGKPLRLSTNLCIHAHIVK